MKVKVLFLVVTMLCFFQTNAQCAMCRAVLESEEAPGLSKGINDGIIYLMAIPYILVFGLFYFIYWKYFKTKN